MASLLAKYCASLRVEILFSPSGSKFSQLHCIHLAAKGLILKKHCNLHNCITSLCVMWVVKI